MEVQCNSKQLYESRDNYYSFASSYTLLLLLYKSVSSSRLPPLPPPHCCSLVAPSPQPHPLTPPLQPTVQPAAGGSNPPSPEHCPLQPHNSPAKRGGRDGQQNRRMLSTGECYTVHVERKSICQFQYHTIGDSYVTWAWLTFEFQNTTVVDRSTRMDVTLLVLSFRLNCL